jgi:hypothetical protein
MTNAITINFEAEFKAIAALAKDASNAHSDAATLAWRYLDFGISSGNLDLLRMLREAMASAPSLQGKLDAWLKACAPVKKVTKKSPTGDKLVSYQKDRVTVRRVGGFRIFDDKVYSVAFPHFKAPKKDKPSMTLEAVLEMLQRSVDGALGKVPDDVEGEPIDAARSTLEHAANTIEGLLLAMKAPTAPTNAEIVTLIKAQRDVA